MTSTNTSKSLTSYAAGDLLYASAGTTLSKLAIGAADTVLRASPTAIRLWFSEGASLPVTRVTLALGGTTIPTGKPTRATGAGQPIVFPLAAPLAAGRYAVKWKTMSADGHAVSGTFAFTVQLPR